MSDITIFHNPARGTTRNALALIRNSGVEPRVVGGRRDRFVQASDRSALELDVIAMSP